VKVFVFAVVMVVAVPAFASSSPARDASATGAAVVRGATKEPSPPRFPRNFHGTGRYVVKDLGVEVPFTWDGRDGDSQMIAGNEQSAIHFTNVISGGYLYTLTYKWPGIPRLPCSKVGPFTLEQLNAFLATSRFVGPEILEGKQTRRVNHFRAGVVWDAPPELVPPTLVTPVGGTPDAGAGRVPLRFPLMLGDFYVDRKDPTKFWQVLHFGLQNLYDEQLDEWIVMDTFDRGAGTVTLPEECADATTPTTTTAPAGG
jgi:hypothetical protein